MRDLFIEVLEVAGYDCEPTEQNVIQCFLDYVDDGVFKDLDYDEAKRDIEDGDITIDQICRSLLKVCR